MAEDKTPENRENPPKRGRGRPRKHPLLEAMAPEQPKRKRGRPRKNPLPDPSQADKPKRKRGRPRKHPVEEQAPQAPQAEVESVTRAEPPRAVEATSPESEPESEAAVIEVVATKRKRGRPRKKPLPESMPANRHRKSAVAAPALRRPITDEDIHRLRTRELAAALDYELRGFEEVIEDFLAEIEEDFTLQIAAFRAELRRKARESGKGADSPSASRVLQKAALRLAKFRNAENVTLEDLSRFQRRLEKLIDRLRRA